MAQAGENSRAGPVTITLGLVILVCLAGMAALGDLRQQTVPFLGLYAVAFAAYAFAVWWSLRRPSSERSKLVLIVGVALLFRVMLLFTSPPTLSDDVHRYIWDGRLTAAGLSPYALPVNSPLLDPFDVSARALVNNDWMASPYLPVTQAYFALVYTLGGGSPLAFQVAAVCLDLLTGGLVLALLHRLHLPLTQSLIYLWNPLVMVEFAHGAHVDALMICLMMVGVYALVATRFRLLSVAALAAATLTKGLPALLLPVVAPRLGWRYTLIYLGLVVLVLAGFGLGSGWGLQGPLDGTGLFGALRIYNAYWNYNGGVYHWLELALTGHRTPGPVPPELVGWGPIWIAKMVAAGALGLVLILVWLRSRQCRDDLGLLRLAVIPLAAYLLLATTIHPWYVTLILPLLPFLPARKGESTRSGRFLLPALYFSAAVALSYLTYLDPENLREYAAVRLVEYIPLYAMLIWAAWPASGANRKTGAG